MRVSVFLMLGAAAAAYSPRASAQAPTLTDAQVALRHCAPQECALRISTRGLTVFLVHGDDQRRERIGYLGGAVQRAVAGVPDAMEEARLGRRQSIISVALLGSMVAGASLSLRAADQGQPLRATLYAVGVMAGSGYASLWQRRKAVQSFDRAVWLYNRSLRP
jgi:hypothetical protein